MSAIKVVQACGQEQKEIKNFESHLEKAWLVGIKSHLLNGVGYALNNAIFLLCTAYGMYFGAIFVWDKKMNGDHEYTAGDTQAIFFGVFFGIFAIGIGAPNFKALTEGRINGN